MSFIRALGATGLQVSALGLGTVKLGRNQQVKYPDSFELPDDASVSELLQIAADAGITLLDTAPAYGSSEERIGKLLQERARWILCTKTGEEFENGQSRFDFSARHTRASVERSLRRLRTDWLDLVLIHSDGNDHAILEQSDCVQTLLELKAQGLVRAIGMSTKTDSGGCAAAEHLDVVMLTWNRQQRDEAALQKAHKLGKGVLVKKGLMSGHVQPDGTDGLRQSMERVLGTAGVSSMIVGTINPGHLRANIALARDILDQSGA